MLVGRRTLTDFEASALLDAETLADPYIDSPELAVALVLEEARELSVVLVAGPVTGPLADPPIPVMADDVPTGPPPVLGEAGKLPALFADETLVEPLTSPLEDLVIREFAPVAKEDFSLRIEPSVLLVEEALTEPESPVSPLTVETELCPAAEEEAGWFELTSVVLSSTEALALGLSLDSDVDASPSPAEERTPDGAAPPVLADELAVPLSSFKELPVLEL